MLECGIGRNDIQQVDALRTAFEKQHICGCNDAPIEGSPASLNGFSAVEAAMDAVSSRRRQLETLSQLGLILLLFIPVSTSDEHEQSKFDAKALDVALHARWQVRYALL